MASITWTDVTNSFAALSAVSAAAQTDILAHTNTALAVAEFGGEDADKLKLARIYLSAHMGALTLRGSTGGVGSVTSKSEGDLSISYGSASGSTSIYGSTVPGQMYLELVRTSPARAGVLL